MNKENECENNYGSSSDNYSTYFKKVGDLKKGQYVCINNRPCKIIDYSSMKNGKHGHCKSTILAVDIFTKKKVEYSQPASNTIDVPEVVRGEYILISLNEDGICELKKLKTNEIRKDIKVYKDSSDEIEFFKLLFKLFNEVKNSGKEEIIATVFSAMNINRIVEFRKSA